MPIDNGKRQCHKVVRSINYKVRDGPKQHDKLLPRFLYH